MKKKRDETQNPLKETVKEENVASPAPTDGNVITDNKNVVVSVVDKGEKNVQSDSKVSVNVSAADTNARIEFADIFASLEKIYSAHDNVAIKYVTNFQAGYGPNEWTFSSIDAAKNSYHVFSLGRDQQSFVVLKADGGNICDISTLMDTMFNKVDGLVENSLKIIKEPKLVTNYRLRALDPIALGYPIDEILKTSVQPNAVNRVIIGLCTPQPDVNPNYSIVNILEKVDLSHIRTLLFNISENDMPLLRQRILDQYLLTRDNAPLELVPIHLTNNMRLSIGLDPGNLNNYWNGFPRAIRFCYDLVLGTQRPNIELISPPISSMTNNMSASSVKATWATAILSPQMRPDMKDNITAYIMSYLAPGLIHFCIDFSHRQ